jgi:hypothetical protein
VQAIRVGGAKEGEQKGTCMFIIDPAGVLPELCDSKAPRARVQFGSTRRPRKDEERNCVNKHAWRLFLLEVASLSPGLDMRCALVAFLVTSSVGGCGTNVSPGEKAATKLIAMGATISFIDDGTWGIELSLTRTHVKDADLSYLVHLKRL